MQRRFSFSGIASVASLLSAFAMTYGNTTEDEFGVDHHTLPFYSAIFIALLGVSILAGSFAIWKRSRWWLIPVVLSVLLLCDFLIVGDNF